jgi:uncharacterized protein
VLLADTGPLYAAVDPTDTHHRRAHDEVALAAQARWPVVVTVTTVAEAHRLILHRLGRRISTRWLTEISESAVVVTSSLDELADAYATLSRLADQDLTLADALAAATASRLGLRVWTYDHHFDVMGVEVWQPGA